MTRSVPIPKFKPGDRVIYKGCIQTCFTDIEGTVIGGLALDSFKTYYSVQFDGYVDSVFVDECNLSYAGPGLFGFEYDPISLTRNDVNSFLGI